MAPSATARAILSGEPEVAQACAAAIGKDRVGMRVSPYGANGGMVADADTVGDRGDAADALQRAEDLGGVEEQISRLAYLLAGGDATIDGQLPNGTEVKLRWPDGEEVTMRVVNYIEETPAGAEDTTLTADSPLGLALYGRQAGETVTYRTPRGELQVDLLAITLP